jgi:2-C-methyl-D-erythritol 4-phosphate cytidylyltransferase
MEEYFAAVILMAGEGRRFGDAIPKQFHALGPQKIYQHTLQTFIESALFEQIILVCHPDWMEEIQQQLPPAVQVVAGGPTRQASSYLGLQACHPQTTYVMIHDAVRPFVTKEILTRNSAAVLNHPAVDTCIPSADTLVHAPDQDFITSIPQRSHYLRGQTPQTFAYPLICEAHQKTLKTDSTDDCSLILELGHPVAVVLGDETNIKITTEFDLEMAKFLSCKNSSTLSQR